jgi:PAS domain S-box-containing protein
MSPDAFLVSFYNAANNKMEIALAIEWGEDLTPQMKNLSHPLEKSGLSGWVMQTGEPLLIGDLQTDPLPVEPLHITEPVRTWLGVPLIAHEQVMGVVSVQSFSPYAFNEADQRFLETIAGQVVIALENARLFEQARQEIVERKRTEAALRESEEKYRTLIEQSNDAIYLIYNDKFEIINRKFKQLFGLTEDQVNMPGFSLLNLAAPKSRPLVEEHLVKETRHGNGSPNFEFTALDHKGREIEVELSISCFVYKDGVATQGILRNITERKHLEVRLREAQKMKAVGQLAGGIAHDFNNILTAINGLIALSLEKVSPKDILYEDLKTIHSQAERGAILVSQLLTFARQQPLATETLNLNQVIIKLSDLLQRAIGENIELKTNLTKDLKGISADITALEQILTNLCFNARDAMPRGGTLIIQTKNVFLDEMACATNPAARPGPNVLLTVTDTGVGIDEEILEHIFDPFFTTKEVGRGSGLGLAMVFGLVKQLNGFIEVQSQADLGSIFKLYFPAATGQEDRAPGGESSQAILGGGETILLIEDDKIVRTLVQRVLENVGYHVVTAPNGETAFELIQAAQEKVDLIITDVIMPKMGGAELYESVKKLSLSPEPKFIFISGHMTDDIDQQFGDDLVQQIEFVKKPFSPTTLTNTIRRILD